MGKFIQALGEQAGSAAGAVIGTGLGMATAGWQDRRQLKQESKLQELNMQGQKSMLNFQNEKALQMWEATGYGGQMEQMQKAGLNPALMYGMGGSGGQTTGTGTANVPSGNAPKGGGEVGMGIERVAQLSLLNAQRKNIEADTALKTADAKKKVGVDTDEAKARIANLEMDKIIKEYTGKEAKAEFAVKDELRTQEYGTRSAELSARDATAAMVVKMYESGLLEKASIAEMERQALSNSKTREETRNIQKQFDLMEANLKGQNLENAILEIEKRLQEKTGIDKNSPYWLKIIGRFISSLME